MKTIIKNMLVATGALLTMASCSENSWNDHLEGFEKGPHFTDVRTLNYTLTDNDYTRIANNRFNVAKAKAQNLSGELSAVATLKYLPEQIQPAEYIPNLLKDSLFAYYGLTEGSSINLTYRVADNLPATMSGLNAAANYRIGAAEYKQVYGSDTDYANSFSPDHSAATWIPTLLDEKYPDAADGQYVIVQYNTSDTNPTFGSAPAPEEPAFEMTSILGSVTLDQNVSVSGLVTGVCAQGYIVSDKTGSILIYVGKTYDGSMSIGDQVQIDGTVSQNNTGFQFAASSSTIKVVGKSSSVTYPTPKVFTGADMDAAIARTTNELPVYCQVTGKISISGTYYNFTVDGATTATGSIYQANDEQKAMLEDGQTYVLTGYFVSRSLSGGNPKFFNVLLTGAEKVASAAAAPKKVGPRKVATIPSVNTLAAYKYNGTTWTVPADVVVIQPSEYEEMGSSYGNLEGTQPAEYLPIFINRKFPYASQDQVKYLLYKYYDGSTTRFQSVQYTYDGSKWENSVTDAGVITETQQFVYKKTGWEMDPSVALELPVGKNKPTSMWFYQAVVDWVKANINDGNTYVDSYGTAEYYSGCSAYQGNVNINYTYSSIIGNAAYNGMTGEQIEATMKQRFETVTGPGALSVLYPKMAPVNGVSPTVTVTFGAWQGDGKTYTYTIVWKCVAKGKFEFVSCTWND